MLKTISNSSISDKVFALWTLFICACIGAALILDQWFLLALPFGALMLLWVLTNYKNLYLLFFALIPFSIEVELPGGFGTDLPSEPIMLGLTGLGLVLFLAKFGNITFAKYTSYITAFLLLHLEWILITGIVSENHVVSFKWLLAKIWYVVPFYFMTIHLLRNTDEARALLRIAYWAMVISALYVMIRHAGEGFTFKSSNDVVRPIFRNHVNYAAFLVILLPYGWALRRWTDNSVTKIVYSISILFVAVAIYFSFTRAAILSIVIAIGAYQIVKYNLVKHTLTAASIITIIGLLYLSTDNNYLKFAPDFEKTITHQKFDNLVEATYKMEDISTMERVYRWVAGAEMFVDKPIFGFGPGNFVRFYNGYTLSSFQTYVSDNPDQSGVHNYYLMTAVEQGLMGLLIFLALVFSALLIGQRKYHQSTSEDQKTLIMSAMLSFIVILSILLINDLIEADKVGPFFFFAMAIIASAKIPAPKEPIESQSL